jgi:hypothetical protein
MSTYSIFWSQFSLPNPCFPSLLSDWSLSSDVVRQSEENWELAPYFFFRPLAFSYLFFLALLPSSLFSSHKRKNAQRLAALYC